MAGKKHTHKYHKVDIAYDRLWACALPNCTHYMPKHLENNLPGKMSICWKCGEEFLLDANNMKNDEPICANCDSAKKNILNYLDEIGVK